VSASSHRVEQGANGLEIQLSGTVSVESIDEITGQVEGLLAALPRKTVLLDLTDVTECGIGACRRLAVLQRKIGAGGCRTAYLTDRARIRGVAWWIVHAAKDPRAMPTNTMAHAERWLEGSAMRIDELHDHATNATLMMRERLAQETKP